MDLHSASNYIKALKRNSKDSIRYYYGEHELSFDQTPKIHVKMYKPTSMRFKLPCFTPDMVDFDCDDHCFNANSNDYDSNGDGVEEMVDGDEIDERAEKFIAEFYAQMKLQR
uniref:Uncharacterized protein n=1 Tax=Kalanchoe fedtschenkoi TaxID=63787 RepID=A0A7N0ZSR4_KALFE